MSGRVNQHMLKQDISVKGGIKISDFGALGMTARKSYAQGSFRCDCPTYYGGLRIIMFRSILDKLDKSVDSELGILVENDESDQNDILVTSISNALDDWWLTERDSTYDQYIETIRKNLESTSKAINDLLADIESKNELLASLESRLEELRQEAKHREALAQLPPETAEFIAERTRRYLRAELEKNKHRNRIIAVIGSIIWIIIGVILENIIETLFAKDIHQLILSYFK